jgi:hypothetical protein
LKINKLENKKDKAVDRNSVVHDKTKTPETTDKMNAEKKEKKEE